MSDTPRTEAILAKIPGGQTCDPQLVADELRVPIAELERELAAEQEIRLNAERTAVLAHDQSERERALADRLGTVLDEIAGAFKENGWVLRPAITEALAAWKDSRSKV